MTLREIASIMNKNVKTIRRWAVQAGTKCPTIRDKMSQATATSKAANFTVEETIEIIKGGGNQNVAGILLDNINSHSKGIIKSCEPTSIGITQRDKVVISETISLCIQKIMPMITNDNNQPMSRPKQLSQAPDLTDRAKLNMIIRDYAQRNDMYFMDVWHILYNQIFYRYKINVWVRAKNANMRPIAYIEKYGLTDKALSIAEQILL